MIEIRRLGQQIGVEVNGVDVKSLAEADFAAIYRAWLDANVLVVRDQDLTIPDFLRYSRRFGPVVPHPSKSTRNSEYPEITMLGVDKFDADGHLRPEIYRRGAEGWHTDGAYNEAPFKATQLYALAVPSRGGNTLFASGYAAYEALPQRLKDRLDGVAGAFAYAGRRGRSKLLNPEDQNWTPVHHPVIRTHPETGRKSLYFDPGKIVGLVGIEEREADDLIAELKKLDDRPRRRIPPRLAQGRHRDLGQSLLVSQGGRRLSARGGPHPLAGVDQRFRCRNGGSRLSRLGHAAGAPDHACARNRSNADTKTRAPRRGPRFAPPAG